MQYIKHAVTSGAHKNADDIRSGQSKQRKDIPKNCAPLLTVKLLSNISLHQNSPDYFICHCSEEKQPTIEFKICLLVYKCLHHLSAPYTSST